MRRPIASTSSSSTWVTRSITSSESRRPDSNRRPSTYKVVALPTELLRRAFHGTASRVVSFGHGPADAFARMTTRWSTRRISVTGRCSRSWRHFERRDRRCISRSERTREVTSSSRRGDRLARVQCKTGRLRGGSVVFRACSSYGHHRNPLTARRDYQGQVDAFAVYCPETAGVYLVPIADLSVHVEATLRVDPPRNGQRKRIRFGGGLRDWADAIHANT